MFFSRSMRHGRATMPFGKHKGVQVRHLPDDYLSWIAGRFEVDAAPTAHIPDHLRGNAWCECFDCQMGLSQRFDWLHESIRAEMRHRGFVEADQQLTVDQPADMQDTLEIMQAAQDPMQETRPKRAYAFE
jgi:hypothetical protein